MVKSPRIQLLVWELKWAHGDSPTKLGIKRDAGWCENDVFENNSVIVEGTYVRYEPNKIIFIHA